MKAKWMAKIRENDERGGDIIRIGIDLEAEYDGETGCRVIADNGDDVGYYRPKTEEECMSDIEAVWGRWDTFKRTQKEGKT